VNINHDEDGEKGDHIETLLDAEYDFVKKLVG
jgi:hypothetical protein